jgi:hypothetical protein
VKQLFRPKAAVRSLIDMLPPHSALLTFAAVAKSSIYRTGGLRDIAAVVPLETNGRIPRFATTVKNGDGGNLRTLLHKVSKLCPGDEFRFNWVMVCKFEPIIRG